MNDDLIVWFWIIVTTLGTVSAGVNVVRAKLGLRAVKKARIDPERKIALLSIAFARLMHQAAIMLAIGFNALAGWIVVLIDPSPQRQYVTIGALVASALTLTLLSAIDAATDVE